MTTSTLKKPNSVERSFSQSTFFWVLLFFFLPLLITGIWLHTFFAGEWETARNQEQERLRKNLNLFLSEIDAEKFFRERFPVFCEEIRRRWGDPKLLDHVSELLGSNAGLTWDCYLFDRAGKLIPGNSRFSDEIARMWRILVGTAEPDDNDKARGLRDFFGKDFHWSQILRKPGKVRPILGQRGDGFLYCEKGPYGEKDGILFIAWTTPSPFSLVAERKNSSSADAEIILGFHHDGSKQIFRHTGAGNLGNDIQDPKNAGKSWVWAAKSVSEGKMVFGKFMAGEVLERRQKSLWAILSVAFLFSIVFSLRLATGKESFFSIRFKLLGLFLYAIFLPILSLITLGKQNIVERRDVLIEEKKREMVDLLTKIDNEFSQKKQKSLDMFRRLRDDPRMRYDRNAMLKYCKELESSGELNWFEARNMKGEFVFTIERPHLTQKIGLMARVNSKIILQRFLQERLPVGAEKITFTPVEVIAQSIIESPISGWGKIMNLPDALHDVRMGDFGTFWYWDVIRDTTHPVAIVQGNQNRQYLTENYLQKALKSVRHNIGKSQVRVFGWRQMIDRYFPVGFGVTPELEAFTRRVKLEGEIVLERLHFLNREFITVGMPCKNLLGFYLFALIPLEEVERPLEDFKNSVIMGITLTVLLAGLLGWVLSQTFLVPIGHLLDGVKSLHSRNLDVQIPDLGMDELGDLGKTFNMTMLEIRDLLYAQSIQAKLIPQRVEMPCGYDFSLINVSCSDVGGDYCDSVPTSTGKILMVIGDVTGHGVSSALVMAMAKYIVVSFAREEAPLTELMTRLNRILFRLLKKKKCMTFFAARLDPANGNLEFSNAGHPLPLIFRKDGTKDGLEICRAPLGFTERIPFEEGKATMHAGEMLLFYTDGIIEIMNPKGKQWGLSSLTEEVEALGEISAEQIRDGLLDAVKRYSDGREADDDITLMVLKRAPQ